MEPRRAILLSLGGQGAGVGVGAARRRHVWLGFNLAFLGFPINTRSWAAPSIVGSAGRWNEYFTRRYRVRIALVRPLYKADADDCQACLRALNCRRRELSMPFPTPLDALRRPAARAAASDKTRTYPLRPRLAAARVTSSAAGVIAWAFSCASAVLQ